MASQGNQQQGDSAPAVPIVAGVPVGRVAPPPGGAADLHHAELGQASAVRPVAVVADIPVEEIIVLSYRRSVTCFAIIDGIITVANVASSLISLGSQEVGKSPLGYDSVGEYWIFTILGLVLFVGPFCGIAGASWLNRPLVMVYLTFCVIKTAFQIAMAFFTPFIWFLISALIQLWILKIVCRFASALSQVPPEHRKQLLEPDYIQRAPVRVLYW